MKYAAWLFDGSYYLIEDGDYEHGIEDIERAMRLKIPIELGKVTVSGSAISKIEPVGKKEGQLEAGFEEAYMLLEARNADKLVGMGERIEIEKDKIRERLVEFSSHEKKERFLSNVRLANKLHGGREVTKLWDVDAWNMFIEAHPHPEKELLQIEKAESGT